MADSDKESQNTADFVMTKEELTDLKDAIKFCRT